MKLSTTLLLATCLLFSDLSGQNKPVSIQDTLKLSESEIKIKKIDSLRRYTRNQFYQNNFDITIEVGQETLKLAKEINDLKTIFSIYSIMGNAFLKIEDTTQAKRIFSKALAEAERIKAINDAAPDKSSQVNYNYDRSIITAKIDLGNYYALQEKAKPAIKLYHEAIPLAEKLKDSSHLFILNFNIAELNLDLKNLEESEFYVNETNRYIEKKQIVEAYRAVAKLNLGRLYLLKNYPALARTELRQCIELAEKSGYTEANIEGHEFYAQSEAMMGNYEASYRLVMKVDSLKSEKYKTDKIEAIETVTAKFKLDQYEKDLEAKIKENEYNKQATKRETTILWIKIAATILFVFSIFLFISDRRRRKLLIDLTKKNIQYLKAKEKTEELSKAKTVLFSKITHELRTPMYGIIGISSLLIKDKKIKEHSEDLRSLKFSADYLLSLINNVLQLTAIDSDNKKKLNKAEFNIYDLIKNVVESAKFINTANPNKYTISITNDIPKLLIGDQEKLSQILMNLVGNSSKFTDAGEIKIELNRLEDLNDQIQIGFCISDTGIGISREMQREMFNEFSHSKTTDNFHGTGLGLPIVKKLLEMHKSEIEISSELGAGTTVNFVLLFERSVNEEEENDSLENRDPEKFKNKRILAVDDNKINLIVTKKTLELYGADVTIVESGRKSIELLRKESFDLILMDINMPEMSGFETTVIIRTFNTEIPIVALTAVELEKVTEESSFDLMNDLIIKPFKNDYFINKIATHLNLDKFVRTF